MKRIKDLLKYHVIIAAGILLKGHSKSSGDSSVASIFVIELLSRDNAENIWIVLIKNNVFMFLL